MQFSFFTYNWCILSMLTRNNKKNASEFGNNATNLDLFKISPHLYKRLSVRKASDPTKFYFCIFMFFF